MHNGKLNDGDLFASSCFVLCGIFPLFWPRHQFMLCHMLDTFFHTCTASAIILQISWNDYGLQFWSPLLNNVGGPIFILHSDQMIYNKGLFSLFVSIPKGLESQTAMEQKVMLQTTGKKGLIISCSLGNLQHVGQGINVLTIISALEI